MKLIIFAALVGVCSCAVQNAYLPPQFGAGASQSLRAGASQSLRAGASAKPDANAAILRSDSEVNELGFQYAYETENGIQAQETGQEADGIQSQGSFSYTGDDGQVYTVRFTADANGFQAQGAHLPTPPPVPEEILKALEQNARDEANGIFDDGSYQEGKYGGSEAEALNALNGVNGFNGRSSRLQSARARPSFNSQTGYRY